MKPNMTRWGDRTGLRWRSSDGFRVSSFNPTYKSGRSHWETGS
ncbi:hypothetical protein [Phormidium nigroviride]